MSRQPRTSRDADYRMARVGAAAALTAVVAVILIVDAIDPRYDLNPVVLVILASLIASLLAVDLPDIWRRG